MVYASKSVNVRRGLPKGLLALILMAAIIGALGVPASAIADSIGCGQCHGTAPLSSSTSEQATGHRTGYETTPGYEDQKTPVNPDICNNKGRGLHGTHMNYSSFSYGGNSTNTILGVTYIRRGNCNYCHNKHPHENGYVEISGMSATARQKVGSVGVRFSGTGMGPNGVDINQMDGAGTCTSACHKNRADTANWGNYTATVVGGIKLNCLSCHDDSSVSATSTLSGNHKNHVLTNCTTPSGIRMSAPNNAGCNNCHPDNSNDLWSGGKADNGTKKAYPHASDGTVITADNASLQGQITAATKSGTNTTCTNACHGRVAVTWGQALDCNMCHYYAASPSDTSNVGTGALSSGHNAHFKASAGNLACTNCHPDRSGETAGNLTHVSRVPAQSYNAVVLASLGWSYAAQTCSSTPANCHNGSTPTWISTNNGCAICHPYPGATGTIKGSTWAAGNGHNVRYDAPVVNTHMKSSGFNYLTDTFASVVADNNKCGLCHRNVKAHRNGTGFAHLSSAGNGNCGGNFTFTSGGVGTGSTQCGSVKCHSGKTTPTMN